MTYDVMILSKYIVGYYNKIDKDINNYKLNALLYFLQANHLMKNNEILFSNDIYAAQTGVIIHDVYMLYSLFGAGNIYLPDIDTSLLKKEFNEDDLILINKVLCDFKDIDYYNLIDIITNQTPWLKAFSRPYKYISTNNNVFVYKAIHLEDMGKFFSS